MRPRGPASPDRVSVRAKSAALGGFLFGYHAAVLAGALLSLRRDFHLSSLEQGALVALLPLGAAVGGLLNPGLADTLGRRRTLMVDAVVIGVGTALSAAAPNYGVLLAGRALVGLTVGSISSTVPLYFSEIAPPATRGRLVTLNQVLVTIGVVAGYLVALVFSPSGSWRSMLAVGLAPAALLFAGMLRAPESPVWLAARAGRDRTPRTRHLLWTRTRRPLLVAVGLALIQQLSGISAIIYYAPSIMERTGLGASRSILYAVIVGVINAVATLAALRLVDRIGRRPLLLISLAGCCVSLVLLGLTFVLPLGSSGSLLSLCCLLAYIGAFAVGLGPLFWLLIAELFPARVRAAGAGVAASVNWLSNFLVGLLFLPLVSALGQGETFFLFACFCAVGLVFVSRYLPETAGRDFAELDTATAAGARRPPSRRGDLPPTRRSVRDDRDSARPRPESSTP